MKTTNKTASKKIDILAEDQKEIRRLKELDDIGLLKEALSRLIYETSESAMTKKTVKAAKKLKRTAKIGRAVSGKKVKISYSFTYVPYKKPERAETKLYAINYITLSLVKESELTGELPLDYDENRLVLQILDPFTAHAYWEVSLQERCRLRLGYGGHFVLRLHNISDSTKEEIWFPEDIGNCFVALPKPASIYRAELGYYSSKRYSCVAISNSVYSPTDKVSEKTAEPVPEDREQPVTKDSVRAATKYTLIIQEPDEKDSGSENFKPL